MNKKIIALFGKSGSGKDTICRYLSQNYDLNRIARITSRPKREGEVDGIDYIFRTDESISKKILSNAEEFLEVGIFNNWYYTTHIDQIKDGWNIGSYDVDAVAQMMQNYHGVRIYPVYIDVSDKNRLIRALTREENPNVQEIVRRYQSDTVDYEDIDFHHIRIDNNGALNFDSIYEQLKKNNIDFNK